MEEANLADWFSAVGSVAGVAVSVVLFWRSRSERKETASTIARGAALAVLPAFRIAEHSLTWSLGQLKDGRKPHYIGTDEDSIGFGVGWLAGDFDRFQHVLTSISQLGPASRSAQRAFHHYRELRDDLRGYDQEHLLEHESPSYEGDAWRATYDRIRRTELEMKAAVAQIVTLLQN